jgi:hypothetical protein
VTEPINGGLSAQGREELRLVASLGLGAVIDAEAKRKAKDMAKDILRGSKGSFLEHITVMTGLLKELVEDHVALKRLVLDLETKMLTDGGVWKAEAVYQPGALVTDHGSPWICLEMNSNTRPPGDCWRLVGKSHR